ncbi:unnamed protein product [Aspergillus oryzae RIB40]|uniref:DNA, SC011 n=2 Tax=Aspergillus oryzae TaxID=5062 RepID=Q2U0L7_ASPOR|nr:unnamed protein product [Aspergillus oryzae RIB40]BAE64898.1 unnamed protein product [Aspergillus oryzae RIB40]
MGQLLRNSPILRSAIESLLLAYKRHTWLMIRGIGHSVLRELNHWVQETCPNPDKPEDMADLARKCYEERKRNGGVFHMLNEATKQGIMSSKVSEQLCNPLYKIRKHITMCLNLIDARMSLTEDFKHGAVVKPVRVPARHLDRTEWRFSFDSITTHIFRSESEKQTFYGHVDLFHDHEPATREKKSIHWL